MVMGSDIISKILTPGLKNSLGLLEQNTIFERIISGPVTEKIVTASTQVIETSETPSNEIQVSEPTHKEQETPRARL